MPRQNVPIEPVGRIGVEVQGLARVVVAALLLVRLNARIIDDDARLDIPTSPVRRLSVPTNVDPAAPAPPTNTIAPLLTGTPTEGETLTVTDGTWSGALPITYARQWYRDNGVTITPVGAGLSTYVLGAGDVGFSILVQVTATNIAGSTGQVSNTLGPVASASVAPVNTTPPVASGVMRIGQMMSSTAGVWTGTPAPTITYQWQRDGVDIALATSSTRAAVAADIGALLTCNVTATNVAGAASMATNALASPWRPILVADPATLIFDGTDPYCLDGVSIGAPCPAMRSINGVLIGSQGVTGNQATRTADGLTFDGADNWYTSPSSLAAYFNDFTSYAIHADGLSGGTGKYFYQARSSTTPALTRKARVAASASTSRNDHRTNSSGALLVGPATTPQDILVVWATGDSTLYDLSAGVSVFATATPTLPVQSLDEMKIGSLVVTTTTWQGNLRGYAVSNTKWSAGTAAIYRACAVAAGVM